MLTSPAPANFVEVERRLWLISPGVLTTLGMSTFLFAFCFPPSLFERVVGERAYVFLDFWTMAFNLSCYGCVLFGIYIAKFFRNRNEADFSSATSPEDGTEPEVDSFAAFPPLSRIAFVLFLGACILGGAVSLAMTAQNVGVGNLAKSMLTGGYRVLVRQQLESETMGLGSLTPLMLPSFGLALGLAATLSHRRWRFAILLFGIAVIAFLFPTAMFARRTVLLRPIFGLVLVMLVFLSYRIQRMTPVILFVALSFMSLVLIVFSAFSVIRMETASTEQQVKDFTRYIVTSYNNESMFIHGKMNWDGEGRGYYWTQFIWSFPILSSVVDLENIRENYLGIRAPHGHIERSKILRQHGVTSSTNISAFGSSYIDFGVLGCLPFMITGFMLQLSFSSLIRNRAFGLVVYPYIAWAALDLRGNLLFPGPAFGYAIIVLFGVYVLNLLFPTRSSQSEDSDEDLEDEDLEDEESVQDDSEYSDRR